MSPEASARLQKTSQDAAEGFHEAPNLAHRKVSRRLFSIAMQNYNSPFAVCPSQAPQLSLRSFEKLFSTPTFSTYSSKFGVHRGTFLSEMQLPTFRSSQCTLKCCLVIVKRSQHVAAVKYVSNNSPISWCRARAAVQSVHRSECAVLFMMRNAQCSLLNTQTIESGTQIGRRWLQAHANVRVCNFSRSQISHLPS